ncbi:hypothetical protein BsWGS_04147 [Bradybaena similaris]
MSSQRGNVSRTRTQKYKNNKAFKNDLHDTSHTIKMINSLNHEGLCQRCKEIIEWKIKYKKYKPLSQPATCVRCRGKTVKRAYHTVCQPCAALAEVCAKCNSKQDIILQQGTSESEKASQDSQLKFDLQHLKERQRRAFFRHLEKGDAEGAEAIRTSVRDFEDSDLEDDEAGDEEADGANSDSS